MKRMLEIMLDISWNKKMKTSEIPGNDLGWLKRNGYVTLMAGGYVKLSRAGNRAILGL